MGPFGGGEYQAPRMEAIEGQADLLYRHGPCLLAVTLEMPDPKLCAPDGGTLGVGLGLVSLAADSDGCHFSGQAVERTRVRMNTSRAALQSKGTRSAKRHLRRLRRSERRSHRDTNHVISKRLVAKGKASQRGIALEDLRHIRSRTESTVKKSQRQRHASWSFAQLRAFLAYKAALAGGCLPLVDPRPTSRTCSVCGHLEPANRKSQARFVCQSCCLAVRSLPN